MPTATRHGRGIYLGSDPLLTSSGGEREWGCGWRLRMGRGAGAGVGQGAAPRPPGR